MRICFWIGSLTTGGAEGQLVKLAPGLVRKGHTVLVVLFHPLGRRRVEELRAAGVRVRCLNLPKLRPVTEWRGKIQALRCLLRSVAMLRRFRADVIHPFFLESELWLVLCKLLGVPGVILTTRLSLVRTKNNSPWKNTAQNFCNRFAEGVIANATAVAEDVISLERNLPREMHVVRNGLPLETIVNRAVQPTTGPIQCLANYHPD
ncbi:MAG: glycosyltransferase, partial [Candidatus Sumerlaeia bacterium]|nr:glycosyltransferase [Candidatus Sumerlaeia bacterium]